MRVVLVGLERSQAAAGLGFGAGGALVLWLILVAFLAVLTQTKRPEPQPAGLELGGDEPPAVVNLLANNWKVRGEALSATLVDLAARHVLDFERTSDGRLVVRVRAAPGDGTSLNLTAYEHKILDLVRRSTNDDVVPVEALTLGTESRAQSFHKSFAKEVAADARQRGLSRPRWSAAMNTIVGVTALLPASLLAGALVALPDAHNTTTTTSSSSGDSNPVFGFIAVGVFAWGALMGLFRRLRAERDTPEGLTTAGRWLGLRENLAADGTFPSLPPTAVAIWDRYLAYAVAMGVAANTERSIPLGAESDHEAWSSVGGTWRIVRVRYPRRIPPGWGRPPWQNAFAGLFNLAIAIVVGGIALPALYSAQGDILKNATTQDHRVAIGVSIGIGVVAIAAALLALRGIWMLVLGVVDIGRGRTIDGRVLRVRRRNEKTYVAVDDGTDDHIAGWISTKSFQQGADVHARVATHNGYVREITVTGAAPPAPDGDITATTPASALAELFSGPAASNATPLELDPAWVASIVGGDVKPGAGSLLRGPHGLAVGGVSLAAGATAAFATISKLPPGMSTPVAGVGDEAARITPISGLAARAGDRGVLVFVRGGGLDESRRYDTAAQIATRCLGDGAAQARAPAPAPAPDAS